MRLSMRQALGTALAVITTLCAFTAIQARHVSPVTTTNIEVQEAKVTVNSKGIQPSRVILRRGVPARLTFTRETEDTCVTEIVIDELGIRVSLPLNESVVVEFTPLNGGKFDYGCGIGTSRAAIVVR